MTKYYCVPDTSQLQIHIHILGYYPIGESMLAIIIDKSTQTVYRSILIDSFEQGDTNLIIPILDRYNLKNRKLDFIFWTHPDYDHSVGFGRIVQDYLSKDTTIILPDGFFSELFRIRNIKSISSWIAVKMNSFRSKMHNVEYVNVSNRRAAPMIYGNTIFSDGFREDINFMIEILTPFAGHVFSKIEANKRHKGNDISLSLMLRFGNQNFYFGGDSENEAINMIQRQKFENVVFIKIPHHSSTTSSDLPKILTLLKNEGKIAETTSVSTSFRKGKSKLPDLSVLEEYQPISSEILLTGNNIHTNKYGVWMCAYNIRPSVAEKTLSQGDASVWYSR